MIRPRSNLLPTDRKYPDWTFEAIETRKMLYAEIKKEPRTAADLAASFSLEILEAIDELRILENFGVIRHRADDLGVISWKFVPDNNWEQEEPPF